MILPIPFSVDARLDQAGIEHSELFVDVGIIEAVDGPGEVTFLRVHPCATEEDSTRLGFMIADDIHGYLEYANQSLVSRDDVVIVIERRPRGTAWSTTVGVQLLTLSDAEALADVLVRYATGVAVAEWGKVRATESKDEPGEK